MDQFLKALMLDLEQIEFLDLSANEMQDALLLPLIKNLLANDECKLRVLDLADNQFQPIGRRTLIKAYALSVHFGQMKLFVGQLPP